MCIVYFVLYFVHFSSLVCICMFVCLLVGLLPYVVNTDEYITVTETVTEKSQLK